MPDACFRHAAFRPSMSVGARVGESSSSEDEESKAPMSSFVGRVLARVGLGRDDDEGAFEEAFSVLSAFGDLGDLDRLEGVDGRACAEAARDGTGFEDVGFAGASLGDGAFGGGAAFGAATFGGGTVFAGVGFGGSGFENFDGVGFGGSGFEDEDLDDFFAGVVGAVVVGVGVWPFASCASCCARSFTLRNMSI
jgi:hypothetical protein